MTILPGPNQLQNTSSALTRKPDSLGSEIIYQRNVPSDLFEIDEIRQVLQLRDTWAFKTSRHVDGGNARTVFLPTDGVIDGGNVYG